MKSYKTNARLFADARQALLGHLNVAVWSLLLITAITVLLAQFSASFHFSNKYLGLTASLAARFLSALIISLFGVGVSSVFLNLQYRQPASVRNLLAGFLENSDTCIRVRFFITAGEYVSLLPLQLFLYIIPEDSFKEFLPVTIVLGAACLISYLMWTLTFSMANFLLLDFPDEDAHRILRASFHMMQGNKFRLFMLYLRLLPLHLLGLFSFGLANIWTGCCHHACTAAFYKDMMTAER